MTQQHPPFRPPRPTLDEETVRLPAHPPRVPVPPQRRPVDPLPAPSRPASRGSTTRTWPWLLGIVVLVPLAVVATLLANRTTLPPTPTTLPPRPPAPASAEPARPASVEVAGDGDYVVGTDVQPGTYRSAGVRTGGSRRCTWTTRAGSATVARGGAASGERQVVEITEKVTSFETAGCAPWVKVG
jgi:hypothetical protein